MTVRFGSQVYSKTKFTVDRSKTPAAIDYYNTRGSNQSKTQKGIYELNGKTLKFCGTRKGKAERFRIHTGRWKNVHSLDPGSERGGPIPCCGAGCGTGGMGPNDFESRVESSWFALSFISVPYGGTVSLAAGRSPDSLMHPFPNGPRAHRPP